MIETTAWLLSHTTKCNTHTISWTESSPRSGPKCRHQDAEETIYKSYYLTAEFVSQIRNGYGEWWVELRRELDHRGGHGERQRGKRDPVTDRDRVIVWIMSSQLRVFCWWVYSAYFQVQALKALRKGGPWEFPVYSWYNGKLCRYASYRHGEHNELPSKSRLHRFK